MKKSKMKKAEIEFPLKLTTKDIYYYLNINISTLLTHKGYDGINCKKIYLKLIHIESIFCCNNDNIIN